MSLDDLFANSGMMTGVEPSSLDSNATLRPQLPTGGSSFSTSIATPSVFSSSASPEEIQQQMLGVLAGSPFPQNDRVRRLSKANEPFLGRDEIGMGVGTGSGSSLDDVSAMGGFGGEEESPSRLQVSLSQVFPCSFSNETFKTDFEYSAAFRPSIVDHPPLESLLERVQLDRARRARGKDASRQQISLSLVGLAHTSLSIPKNLC